MVEPDQVQQIELLHIILELQHIQHEYKGATCRRTVVDKAEEEERNGKLPHKFPFSLYITSSQLCGRNARVIHPLIKRTLDHPWSSPLISIKFLVRVHINTDGQVVTRGDGSA